MSVWVGSGCGVEARPPVTTAAVLLSTNTSMESGIEAGVLPTVTGSLASARDSLGSLSRPAEPLYDTDHTDLGSELDEAEIRRELMHDKWRLLFDRFDPEGFGEIPWPDFIQTLQHPDFIAQVSLHKREILLDKAHSSTSNVITFQEFVNVGRLEDGDFNGYWLVGDKGYANKPYLLTPLRNPVSDGEKLYNESQIRTRNVIERTFGAWKRRFPALSMKIRTDLKGVQPIIVAIAVLHNICKKMRDPMPPMVLNRNEDSDSSSDEDEYAYTVARNDESNRSQLINNYFSRLH